MARPNFSSSKFDAKARSRKENQIIVLNKYAINGIIYQ
jgi:hypothetical protein